MFVLMCATTELGQPKQAYLNHRKTEGEWSFAADLSLLPGSAAAAGPQIHHEEELSLPVLLSSYS